MGEIFKFERAPAPLGFTGERMTSQLGGQIEIEHMHRYLWARDMGANLDVLDIASGEGYGSALLAQKAKSVVGVEIDAGALQHAIAAYPRPNLTFLQGEALKIPLDDASVDLVVSFETIEHIMEHERFILEMKRVLRPNGVVMISTPDRDLYSVGGYSNPFHLKETSREEFIELIKQHFTHCKFHTQRPMIGSAIVPMGVDSEGKVVTYEKRNDHFVERNLGLQRAPYIVAVASEREIQDAGATSLYIDTSRLDAQAAEAAAADARVGALMLETKRIGEELEGKISQAHDAGGARIDELAHETRRIAQELAAVGKVDVSKADLERELARARSELAVELSKAQEAQVSFSASIVELRQKIVLLDEMRQSELKIANRSVLKRASDLLERVAAGFKK